MNAGVLVIAGIIVIFIGIIMILIGTALQSTSKNEEVRTGGVILIGPIPIISAMIFAVIIIVLWYLLIYRGLL
jgi:uncharacterized protein (TIGR00304 family)